MRFWCIAWELVELAGRGPSQGSWSPQACIGALEGTTSLLRCLSVLHVKWNLLAAPGSWVLWSITFISGVSFLIISLSAATKVSKCGIVHLVLLCGSVLSWKCCKNVLEMENPNQYWLNNTKNIFWGFKMQFPKLCGNSAIERSGVARGVNVSQHAGKLSSGLETWTWLWRRFLSKWRLLIIRLQHFPLSYMGWVSPCGLSHLALVRQHRMWLTPASRLVSRAETTVV